MTWQTRHWDEEELARVAGTAARLLRDAGLRPGHRVGLLSGNDPLFVIATLACRKAGLTVVPFSPSWPENVIREKAEAGRIDLLVTRDDLMQTGWSPPGGIIRVGPDDVAWPRPTNARIEDMTQPSEADLLAILFTSGTTGRPRAWGYTKNAVQHHAEAATKRLRLDKRSVVLGVLPLCHAGGFMALDRALRTGNHLVLEEKFQAFQVRRRMEEHHVTHTSLVPLMLRRLMEHDPTPPQDLRGVLLGGDAIPRKTLEMACKCGWPVYASYGLTETCSQAATAQPEQACTHPGTSGRPLDGVTIRIEDDQGEPCAPGEEGHIVITGPTLARPLAPGPPGPSNPLKTGDRGHLDAEGRLFVTGRTEQRIVTRGHTVAAQEVEHVLESLPGIAASCVVGIGDEEHGQSVGAIIEPEPGPTHPVPDADTIRRSAQEHLPRYAVPRHILIKQLPRTPLGKKDRLATRRLLEAHAMALQEQT